MLDEPEVGHRQPPAALSLTQSTEYGTVYSEEDLRHLIEPAKARGLGVHLDGARLANAAAAGFDLTQIARLGAEALVIFDRSLARRVDNRLKQTGQTASKARYLSGPMLGLLESGAWETGAAHANLMAQRLAAGLTATSTFALAHPVEANAVFVRMPPAAHQRLNDLGWACYRFADGSVRFVCSWTSTEDAVDELLTAVATL